jgi:hypothetical protein
LDKGRANPSGLVRVQWDPERSVRIGKLDYRSIQMGIPNALIEPWISQWIISIEDVTEKARELKRKLDDNPNLTHEELVQMNLVPEERVYRLSEDLRSLLEMNEVDDSP